MFIFGKETQKFLTSVTIPLYNKHTSAGAGSDAPVKAHNQGIHGVSPENPNFLITYRN
jgi:hypothetical protein